MSEYWEQRFPEIHTVDEAIAAARDEGFTCIRAAELMADEIMRLRDVLRRSRSREVYECPACGHHGRYPDWMATEDHTCTSCGEAAYARWYQVPAARLDDADITLGSQ